MHLANASTVSNNERHFNASCHFRNRRWHLFLKWQTSLNAGKKLISCDCHSPSSSDSVLCCSEALSTLCSLNFKTQKRPPSTVKHLNNIKMAPSLSPSFFSWQTRRLHQSQHLVRSGTDRRLTKSLFHGHDFIWQNQHKSRLMTTALLCVQVYWLLKWTTKEKVRGEQRLSTWLY